MSRKTTDKTTELRPQPHGGALRNGGTNAGGPGRPPDEFKALMRSLADRAAQALAVSRILDDPSDDKYLPAAKWAQEAGYGKAAQQVEHTGKDGGPIALTITYDDDGDA